MRGAQRSRRRVPRQSQRGNRPRSPRPRTPGLPPRAHPPSGQGCAGVLQLGPVRPLPSYCCGGYFGCRGLAGGSPWLAAAALSGLGAGAVATAGGVPERTVFRDGGCCRAGGWLPRALGGSPPPPVNAFAQQGITRALRTLGAPVSWLAVSRLAPPALPAAPRPAVPGPGARSTARSPRRARAVLCSCQPSRVRRRPPAVLVVLSRRCCAPCGRTTPCWTRAHAHACPAAAPARPRTAPGTAARAAVPSVPAGAGRAVAAARAAAVRRRQVTAGRRPAVPQRRCCAARRYADRRSEVAPGPRLRRAGVELLGPPLNAQPGWAGAGLAISGDRHRLREAAAPTPRAPSEESWDPGYTSGLRAPLCM